MLPLRVLAMKPASMKLLKKWRQATDGGKGNEEREEPVGALASAKNGRE